MVALDLFLETVDPSSAFSMSRIGSFVRPLWESTSTLDLARSMLTRTRDLERCQNLSATQNAATPQRKSNPPKTGHEYPSGAPADAYPAAATNGVIANPISCIPIPARKSTTRLPAGSRSELKPVKRLFISLI